MYGKELPAHITWPINATVTIQLKLSDLSTCIPRTIQIQSRRTNSPACGPATIQYGPCTQLWETTFWRTERTSNRACHPFHRSQETARATANLTHEREGDRSRRGCGVPAPCENGCQAEDDLQLRSQALSLHMPLSCQHIAYCHSLLLKMTIFWCNLVPK